MLRLNLIPLEKRVVRRTPPFILLLLIVAVGILSGAAFFVVKIEVAIDYEESRSEDLARRLSALSADLSKYEKIMSEISSIEALTASAKSIVQRDFFLSDILGAVQEAYSASPGINITDVELLPDDQVSKVAKEAGKFKFGIKFKGDCSSCVAQGAISTKPMEFLKWRIIRNPEVQKYSLAVVNKEPYKMSKSGAGSKTVLVYEFVVYGD